jgi:hypothetical protein
MTMTLEDKTVLVSQRDSRRDRAAVGRRLPGLRGLLTGAAAEISETITLASGQAIRLRTGRRAERRDHATTGDL